VNIDELTKGILALFRPKTERRIKEVESWDGSASQFDSTEDYCNACLINVNAAAGNSGADNWKQDHCMLPVREPGDSKDTYVDKAVIAAAGGHGVSAVKKPADVSSDAWDSALKSAANKIISAYNTMDMTAPDAVYSAADKEPPEKGEEEDEDESRATSIPLLYEQIANAAYQAHPEMYVYELYAEQDRLYVIAINEGSLYRAPLVVQPNGVLLGEFEQVEVQHVPTARTLSVTREDSGRYRWAGIACTAILNKVGEVDSRALFDNFVQRFNAEPDKPVYLDFFHEDIFLGRVDYLAREGFTLLASGTFNDDEVGAAVAEGILRDDGYWGQSICYRPLSEPGKIVVGDVEFPVWEDGQLERIALLPAGRAAAWYTTMNTRSENMRPEILAALARLIGEDKAKELALQVDVTNERALDSGVIAREADAEAAEAEALDPEAEDADTNVVEVTPDVDAILRLRTTQNDLQRAVDSLIEMLNEFVPGVEARLDSLERSEEERRRAYIEDLPAPTVRQIVRPRETRASEAEQVDTATHVQKVLEAKGVARVNL